MKLITKVLLLAMLGFGSGLCTPQSMKEVDVRGAPGFQPRSGMVPNKDTAIQIAIAVLTPIYGADVIKEQRPFVASIKGGIWTVVGTPKKQRVGGAAEIRISKMDGRILYVMHGQ
jgi:hypothetical protein